MDRRALVLQNTVVGCYSWAAAADCRARPVRKPVSLGLRTSIMDGSSQAGNHTSVGKYPLALVLLKER